MSSIPSLLLLHTLQIIHTLNNQVNIRKEGLASIDTIIGYISTFTFYIYIYTYFCFPQQKIIRGLDQGALVQRLLFPSQLNQYILPESSLYSLIRDPIFPHKQHLVTAARKCSTLTGRNLKQNRTAQVGVICLGLREKEGERMPQ